MPAPLLRKLGLAGAVEQPVDEPGSSAPAVKVICQRADGRLAAAVAGQGPPVLDSAQTSLPKLACLRPLAPCAQYVQEKLGSVPWPALLEEEEVMRGLAYYGSGTGLRRVAAKLLAGQPVKIVSLGGSITATGGEDPAGPVREVQLPTGQQLLA